MAILTRSITNASSTIPLVLSIPGFDPTSAITVAPSATLDLLTVMDATNLHAFQAQVAELVAAGAVTVALTINSTSLYPGTLIARAFNSDTQVVFNPTTITASHVTGATVLVQIENAIPLVDTFDNSTTVTVAASGTHTILLNGHSSPITLTVNGGVASVLVTDSAADTVTLSFSANSRSLTETSTCTVTMS